MDAHILNANEAADRKVSARRDIGGEEPGGEGFSTAGLDRTGRNLILVIGIDRYRHTQHWPRLSNAVNDACGAAALFEQLGFVQAMPALIDDAATGRAIQGLASDDHMALGPEDSLVLFYAGHGGNRRRHVGSHEVTTGYLIPVDAEDSVSTWIDLEGWLRDVASLPPRHILVILDACNSGIALDPVIKWRDATSWHGESLATLSARRSRRIITSALGDQRAMDSGPYLGHSLFTGCLIEELAHGLHQANEQMITASELGLRLQKRVSSYPDSQQTPDFGTFAFDERGELMIALQTRLPVESPRATSSIVAPASPVPVSDLSPPPATVDARFADTPPLSLPADSPPSAVAAAAVDLPDHAPDRAYRRAVGDIVVRPSAKLRAWLEGQIDSFVDRGLGDWPRRVGREARAFLIDGDGAFVWYLGLDGDIFRLDTDDFRQTLEPVTNREEYVRVLRAAVANHPQLAELIDDG